MEGTRSPLSPWRQVAAEVERPSPFPLPPPQAPSPHKLPALSSASPARARLPSLSEMQAELASTQGLIS